MSTYEIIAVKTHEIARNALRKAESFLDFVRQLRSHDIYFNLDAQHPYFIMCDERVWLARISLLNDFRWFIWKHEQFTPDLASENEETTALEARVLWMHLSGFTDDLLGQQKSLETFAAHLNIDEIGMAMRAAWAAQNIENLDHRYRYACAILQPLRKKRMAAANY